MKPEERVFIAGAGPVGLTAAAALAQQGVPVTVFEASPILSAESRASTFHPPTLDMLADLGIAQELVDSGLKAPILQYRTKAAGRIADFDFTKISDVTRHPYRLQNEQYNLTRILHKRLQSDPLVQIEFGCEVETAAAAEESIVIRVKHNGRSEERRALWLIGADGARSAVRKSLGIVFEGFTWPERFLVITTSFDFGAVIPDLANVSYVADPKQWHFFLRTPTMWRMMFPVSPDIHDDEASSVDFARKCLSTIVATARDAPVAHVTLYRVHQRVANSFRQGRAFLAGDAAHINNPLGGMGMNGGIHDAVNLSRRLASVWNGWTASHTLDRYDRQRRLVTLEHVQKQSIENKKNLESQSESEQTEFRDRMTRISADPDLEREFLLKVSMISSLKRASELG